MVTIARSSASLRVILSRAVQQPSKVVVARVPAVASGVSKSKVTLSVAPQRMFQQSISTKNSEWNGSMMQFYTSAYASDEQGKAPLVEDNTEVFSEATMEDNEVNDDLPPPPPPPPVVEGNKLYIGNIPWTLQDQDLREAFEQYGNVSSCEVVMDLNGRSRGFAFVTFDTREEAGAAIEGLNNQFMDGRELRVDYH